MSYSLIQLFLNSVYLYLFKNGIICIKNCILITELALKGNPNRNIEYYKHKISPRLTFLNSFCSVI